MLHLKVKKRDKDKVKAKNLLKESIIPAIMYGPKIKPTALSLNAKIFTEIYKKAGGTTLIALDMKEKAQEAEGAQKSEAEEPEEDNVVLIRDIQTHPVSGKFIHVDFYQLPMDQAIEISVPVNSVNEAPAVKERGGILVHNIHEILIKALPKNLIHDIDVDLVNLKEIGDSILVKDLGLPSSIEILTDFDSVVFSIEAPREEEVQEEEETLEEMEDEQISEIKTEGEEKREDKEEDEDGEEASKPSEGEKL